MANLEKRSQVVGGGLLACEAAASLRMMKLKVSFVFLFIEPYVDPGGRTAYGIFHKHGVTMLMGKKS
jgi:hypothetical protein